MTEAYQLAHPSWQYPPDLHVHVLQHSLSEAQYAPVWRGYFYSLKRVCPSLLEEVTLILLETGTG